MYERWTVLLLGCLKVMMGTSNERGYLLLSGGRR